MSGGHFDYQQHRINDIVETIEDIISNNRILKTPEDLFSWDYDENGNVREDSKYYYNFSDETIKEFKKGINFLKKAYVYAERIDYLLSGDDGEDTFHERLKEDLEKITKNKK